MKRNLNKSAFARLYYIDAEIAAGNYPSASKLARDYEAGRATICRDIEFMRDRLHAPIEYSPKRRGYYYTEKTFRLSATFADGDDLLALACVKTLLSLYRDAPFYQKTLRAMEAVTAPFLAEDFFPVDRIVVPALASYRIGAEIWEPVVAALRENRALAFDYQSLWTRPFERRLVHPYQVLFDSGAWYLYAFSVERQDRRMFSLSRIKNIALTDDTFTLPPDFDYRKVHGESFFGVYAGRSSLTWSSLAGRNLLLRATALALT